VTAGTRTMRTWTQTFLAAGLLAGMTVFVWLGASGCATAPAREAGGETGAGGEAGAGGFKVFIVPDMEGMTGTVFSREVLSGFETGCETCFTSPDYERYRGLLAEDVNAVIAGAREAGATAFSVNEGHGGNDFANIQPFELDPAAVLIRGWPKPLVMITGLDETFDTAIFIGAHANAGSPGVMAHNFAVDAFTVNGVPLNEVGINALMAGQMGVSVSLVSGDDVLVEETHGMIGEFEEVVSKVAYGRNAAATWTPAKVRERLRAAARRAVENERKGMYPPFVLEKPYRVEFTLRKSFADRADEVAGLARYRLERTGPASFRFETDDSLEIGHFLNDLELIVF
jgi:D-amino peptidase